MVSFGGLCRHGSIHKPATNLDVTPLYTQYIFVWGAVAVPILAAYLIRTYPGLVSRVAPLIATLFTPVVVITLVAYFISLAVTGNNLFLDWESLLVFNVMLLGVMALIIFSVAEAVKGVRQRFGEIVLFVLSFVTLIVNLLALSAIIYRLDQFGLTPNRLAVLGSNILIFGHLTLIMLQLYRVCFQRKPLIVVEQTIVGYLPVYGVWALLVVIGWPLFFNLF